MVGLCKLNVSMYRKIIGNFNLQRASKYHLGTAGEPSSRVHSNGALTRRFTRTFRRILRILDSIRLYLPSSILMLTLNCLRKQVSASFNCLDSPLGLVFLKWYTRERKYISTYCFWWSKEFWDFLLRTI